MSPHRSLPLTTLLALAIPAAAGEFRTEDPAWKTNPAHLGADSLSWRLDPHCQFVERGGKTFLRVDAPEKTEGYLVASADIDLAPFAGKDLSAAVRLRAKGVRMSKDHYPGVLMQLTFKDPENDKTYWLGPEQKLGDFDWLRWEFSETIPKAARRATLRLGIENASGMAEFDLSSLEIKLIDLLEKEPGAVLSPAAAAEFDRMEERLRDFLLAGKAEAKEYIDGLVARLEDDGRFSGIDYLDNNRSRWRVAGHLDHVMAMARAWAAPGHPLRHDESLGNAVRKAVGWWSRTAPRCGNWWFNDMFVPQKMAEILLMAPALFPPGPEREAALEVCRQARFLPRYTGNNRVFIAANVFKRAILERNERALNAAAAALAEEIRMAEAEDKTAWAFGGLRADGAYHQHGPQLQFGNYGAEFLQAIGHWANIWKDTRWELTQEQWRIMRHYAFDGVRWTLWKGDMDLLAIGRQLGRDAAALKGRRALDSFRDLRRADPGDPAPYDAVLAGNDFDGTKHFWNSDYLVHRRPGWFAALRMNSTRVRPIEDDTNRDNALGRYFSDGVCLLYRSGEEYRDITACWDWTRLPGTTLPATPIHTPEESESRGLKIGGRPPRWTHSRDWRRIGVSPFVGGVTDGAVAAAVHTQDIDGVRAKKAYFFDRDAVWQLGVGIEADSPFPVATTVNVCLRNGRIRQGPGWFHHDGVGYRGEGMALEVGRRQGDWRYTEGGLNEALLVEKELFGLKIDHGVQPRGASYAFVVLPGIAPEAVENWAGGKVLANGEDLQAVELADGAVAAVFHAPGKLGGLESRVAGLFLIRGDELWYADPTAALETATVAWQGVERSVKLPGGELAGSSVGIP